jgi:predicted nucleotide-binding protein (sugar kinase/HSP70/actin superfamily)
LKSKLQSFSQHASARKLHRAVEHVAEMDKEVHLKEMFERCNKYIHQDYDGDPPLAIGSASALVDRQISGIMNILPFTCMPGTLICSISNNFRKDHDNLPWENIAYDGQDDTNIDTRLQAFMHQANEYCKQKKFDVSRKWVNKLNNKQSPAIKC